MVVKILIKVVEIAWTAVFCVFNALGPIALSLLSALLYPVMAFTAPRTMVKLLCYMADYQWWYFATGFESWGRSTFHFYGHKAIPDRENCLVILNHVSIMDWLYVLNVAGRRGRMGCVKYFAKDLVKYWPGFGWGVYMLDSVFLKRDWMKDLPSINKTFHVLKSRKLPFWLTSYVEGTRATPKKIQEGQEFARARGLPVLNYLCFPRTKGFVCTVQGLRDATDSILDVTWACTGGKAPTVVDIAWRRVPDFHFHIRRFPIKDIPTDEKGISEWLIKRFVEKDELLAHFHKHGKFPDPVDGELWPVPYKHKSIDIWNL